MAETDGDFRIPSADSRLSRPSMRAYVPQPSDSNPDPKVKSTDGLDEGSLPSFRLGSSHRSYRHQFSNIYFVRLRMLRESVKMAAEERWRNLAEKPEYVERVLEVVKNKLCYIIGTVYMHMPLKPNVLDDIEKDHSIPLPPPRGNYASPDDEVMLEDESGRIQLVGGRLTGNTLVTGVIMAVLGLETATGEFEAVDVCFAGLPPPVRGPFQQSNAKNEDDEAEWVALVSGLDVGSPSSSDAKTQLLVEYLTAESGGSKDQAFSSKISRLIIAGNSMHAANEVDIQLEDLTSDRKNKRTGNETTSFSTHAVHLLGSHLADIVRAMPVHILAGDSDPSGVLLPQQPMPRALFGEAKVMNNFMCETNPTWLRIQDRTCLVNSGQPLSDMCKYLHVESTARIALAASTLSWRHQAPTAPDTLWCYPYFTADPFIMPATPDLYIIGNQPSFETKIVKGQPGGHRCRIVLLPSFALSGTLVLVNLHSLKIRTIEFSAEVEIKQRTAE